MIGFMIPDALGKTYVNDAPYEFSIDYPNGWLVEKTNNFYDDGVIFSDKQDWTTSIYVWYFDNVGTPLSDQQEIDHQYKVEEDYCKNLSFRDDGMICYDFQKFERNYIHEVNGYHSFTIVYYYTYQYDDPNFSGEYPMVGATTNIYVGNDIWQFVSETDDYIFDETRSHTIGQIIDSFRLGDVSQSVPTFTPSSNTHYKIYFEELPEWSEFNIDSAVNDATNYWNNRDGITFSRTYDPYDAQMYVSWIKNYGHSVLGTYIGGAIDVGLGDDLCAGTWQPFSQQTASETLTHEIGHHLGYDDLEYSPDTSDIMAYSNTNVSYEYESWTENSMIGYGMAWPVCTYENGITYDYRLTSDSNHKYDVFFVPSIGEYQKFMEGEDYRSACGKYDVRNTNGSCKVNNEWYSVVYVSGGSDDTLAQFELTLSETNLPGTSTTTSTSLPPITTNDTPINSDVSSTISVSNKFFSAHGNEFTTVTLSGFVPEQFLNNRTPAYLAITFEGKLIDELKVRITDQGKFSVPFQLSPDASYGTYVVTARNSLGTFGSTTFSYGISETIVPPSVSSSYENMSQSGGQNDLPAFKQFASNQYGFSINYSPNWVYEEGYACYDEDGVCMLNFKDDKDYWTVEVNVNFWEGFNSGYTWNSDEQYIDDSDYGLRDECENSREYGYDYNCSNYMLQKSDVLTINGKKAYLLEWTETLEYDDGTYDRITSGSIELPINDDDAWQIYYSVLDEYSDYNLPLIEQSISSFKLNSANAQVSESAPTNEIENNMCGAGTILKNGICVAACGDGTIYKDGKCEIIQTSTPPSSGGGCLIATAAFGSEMAPQVQFLRELRDNTVLQTTSGTTFMTGFNQFYYSFSPAVADYERENPVFKEAVKVTLTPLLTSLTLLNYVDIDTEEEMLGYGIGIILLNVGMYFVAPAVLIIALKKRFL